MSTDFHKTGIFNLNSARLLSIFTMCRVARIHPFSAAFRLCLCMSRLEMLRISRSRCSP